MTRRGAAAFLSGAIAAGALLVWGYVQLGKEMARYEEIAEEKQ